MKLFQNDILADKRDELNSYLMAFKHESSAQCFSYLYMWRDVHDFCYEIIDGHLCIEGTYRPDQASDELVHYLYPPIPASGELKPEVIRDVCGTVKDMFDKAGEPLMIKRLPGSMKAVYEQAFPDVEITEDRTYFDYLYSLEELIELRGRRFHGKKNHFNAFNKSYEHEIKLFEPSMASEVLDLIDRLNAERDDTPEDAAALVYERKAIVDVMDRAQDLGYMGCSIHIDGRMAAFAFGGRLDEDTICEHVEKANTQYRGAYVAINNAFCRMASDAGFAFVNREEDMGSENLRKSKLSYNPVKLIDKYELRF